MDFVPHLYHEPCNDLINYLQYRNGDTREVIGSNPIGYTESGQKVLQQRGTTSRCFFLKRK